MKSTFYNFCYLNLRTTRTNIYITLTDIKGNVIIKLSSGMLKTIFNLKTLKKNVVPTAKLLIIELKKIIKKKKIIIKLMMVKTDGFIFYGSLRSMHWLSTYLFPKQIYTIVKNKIAHNGVRLRKQRRK